MDESVTIAAARMYCRRCGASIRLDSIFCAKCGAPVAGSVTPSATTAITVAPAKASRQSGMGVASFTIACVSFVLLLAIFIGIIALSYNVNSYSTAYRLASVAGLLLLLNIVALLVGVGLGIAGVAQHNRKKLLPVLGLVLNSLMLIGLFALTIIGYIRD